MATTQTSAETKAQRKGPTRKETPNLRAIVLKAEGQRNQRLEEENRRLKAELRSIKRQLNKIDRAFNLGDKELRVNEIPMVETCTLELPVTHAALLGWLGGRNGMTRKEYVAKIICEYLESALTQLNDKEAHDLLEQESLAQVRDHEFDGLAFVSKVHCGGGA